MDRAPPARRRPRPRPVRSRGLREPGSRAASITPRAILVRRRSSCRADEEQRLSEGESEDRRQEQPRTPTAVTPFIAGAISRPPTRDTGAATKSTVADRQLPVAACRIRKLRAAATTGEPDQLPLVVLTVDRVGDHLGAVLVRHGQTAKPTRHLRGHGLEVASLDRRVDVERARDRVVDSRTRDWGRSATRATSPSRTWPPDGGVDQQGPQAARRSGGWPDHPRRRRRRSSVARTGCRRSARR